MNETAFQGQVIPCHRLYPQRGGVFWAMQSTKQKQATWGTSALTEKPVLEPVNLKLELGGHTGSGALTWQCTLSPRTQPQQKLGNTHKECTARTRKVAMVTPQYLCCLSIYVQSTWRTSLEWNRCANTAKATLNSDPKPTAIKGSPLQQTTCSTHSFNEYSESVTRKYQRYIEQRVSYSILMSSPSQKQLTAFFSLLDAVQQFNAQRSSHMLPNFMAYVEFFQVSASGSFMWLQEKHNFILVLVLFLL